MQAQFICLGFQKSGTTTLWEVLRQHSQIALTRDVKEPMFYRVKGIRAIGGKRWYEWRYFGNISKADRRLRGEVNAMLTTSNCAEKIAKDFSADTKLIFMMRDPAERAYSAYKYFMALGFLPMEFVEYDKIFGHSAGFHHYCKCILGDRKKRSQIMDKRLKYLVFSQGNYMSCISEYLRYFPKENMKFIFFEDFIRDQKTVCEDLYEFLGVEPEEGIDYGIKSNEGTLAAGPGASCKAGQVLKGVDYALYEFFYAARYVPGLYKKFDRLNKRIQNYCVVEDKDHSKMDAWTRRLLNYYYRKEIVAIAELTGRDVSAIWKCKQ